MLKVKRKKLFISVNFKFKIFNTAPFDILRQQWNAISRFVLAFEAPFIIKVSSSVSHFQPTRRSKQSEKFPHKDSCLFSTWRRKSRKTCLHLGQVNWLRNHKRIVKWRYGWNLFWCLEKKPTFFSWLAFSCFCWTEFERLRLDNRKEVLKMKVQNELEFIIQNWFKCKAVILV